MTKQKERKLKTKEDKIQQKTDLMSEVTSTNREICCFQTLMYQTRTKKHCQEITEHVFLLVQHKLHRECEGQWDTPGVQCVD